jgi:hypothetical protein
MTMTNQNFFSQTRSAQVEPDSTDPATVSDPSRPEYDPKSPYYQPQLDSSSPQYGAGLSFKPFSGGAGRPTGKREAPARRAEKR